MSDTPRTDNATIPHYDAEPRGCVPIDFAESLERDLSDSCTVNDNYKKELTRLLDEIDWLTRRLNMERADAARIEWLIGHAGGVMINLDDNFLTRQEIDEAMEAEKS